MENCYYYYYQLCLVNGMSVTFAHLIYHWQVCSRSLLPQGRTRWGCFTFCPLRDACLYECWPRETSTGDSVLYANVRDQAYKVRYDQDPASGKVPHWCALRNIIKHLYSIVFSYRLVENKERGNSRCLLFFKSHWNNEPPRICQSFLECFSCAFLTAI